MDNAVQRPLPYRRRTARSGTIAGETSKNSARMNGSFSGQPVLKPEEGKKTARP